MEEKKLTDEVVVAKNAITDEEIVKALEMNCLCVVYGKENCESCLLFEKDCRILPNAVVDLIHRQKAEIERLTEYNENLNGMCLEFIDKNAELQKQVNELKEKIMNLKSAMIDRVARKSYDTMLTTPDDVEEIFGDAYESEFNKFLQQTVKDTAKEILQGLEERKERVKAFYGINESVGVDIAIRAVKEILKQKGVEVE